MRHLLYLIRWFFRFRHHRASASRTRARDTCSAGNSQECKFNTYIIIKYKTPGRTTARGPRDAWYWSQDTRARRPESLRTQTRTAGGQEVKSSGSQRSTETSAPMSKLLEAFRWVSSSASAGEAGLAKLGAASGSADAACICVPVWPAGSTAGSLGAGLGLMIGGRGGSTSL